MTVPVPGSLIYIDNGDGVTTSFSYPVRFLDKAEIVVALRDNTGDTVQVLGTDYTIAGSSWPTGGNVVFNTAPPAGKKIVRYRSTTAKQVVDLENTQRNDAGAVETQLDRLAMVQQDQGRDISRALKMPAGADPLPLDHYALSDGKGGMKDGGSATDIANAQENAASARADAELAEIARAAAQAAQPQAFPVNRAAVAALPDNVVNAYLTETGFEGYFKQVDATDPTLADLIAADTVGGDIKVSAGNPDLAWLRQRKYGDLIKTSEFGHDLTVALAVAGERRKLFGPDARVDVLINQTGTLALSKALQPPTGVNFFSDKRLVLDANSLANGDFYDSTSGLIAAGGRTVIDVRPLGGVSRAGHYSSALPAFDAIATGDISVNFPSGHGRSVGDVLVWYDSADGSWFGERAEYRLSMRRRVVGVASSTKLYLDKPARDAFTYSSTCKAYVQTTMPAGRFGGWAMDLEGAATTGIQGVHLLGIDERSEVADIIATGAGYSGIALAQCLNLRPKRLRGGTKMGTAGDSVYPIQIQNCTDVRVRGSEGAGDWHTLAMTGAGGFDVGQTINEDCWYEDCKAYNTGGSIVGSVEMHGNSDRCGFLNCEASEAVLGGRDASLIGGAIDNAQTDVAGQGKLVFIGEQHSGRSLIQGTRMRSVKNTGTSSNSGAIYCYAGDNQKGEIFIDIRDVFIDAPTEQTPILIGRGFGNNAKFSVSFDGVVNVPSAGQLIKVPNFTAGIATSSYFRIERATGLTNGVPWAFFGNDGAGGPFAAFTDMQFPKQKVEWVTSGVAAASEVSSAFNWPHAYPNSYVPPATVEIQKSTLGAKASAHLYDVTRTTVQAIVATGDGTNLGATATRVTIFGW